MQITLNQNEVQGVLAAYIVTAMPSVEPEEVKDIVINEDGTATIHLGEEAGHDDDSVPVVEKKTRRRRSNPAEAKHVPVEAKKELEQPAETQTSTGGQNESSSQEPEAQGEEVVTLEEKLKEEVTEQAEEASQEAEVQQEVQEEKAVEASTTKPSLFANLKR